MKTISLILSLIVISLAGGAACASTSEGRVPLLRDYTYEANLRWEASADKVITPAKVFRWMLGLRGQTLSAPTQTEFQPIVNVHDSHIRVIAAFAYKF